MEAAGIEPAQDVNQRLSYQGLPGRGTYRPEFLAGNPAELVTIVARTASLATADADAVAAALRLGEGDESRTDQLAHPWPASPSRCATTPMA
jgi:hypothetical protein